MFKRLVVCFLIFICSNNAFSQLTPNELRFNLYNYNFFVNNEYKGVRVSGYTLPGFRITPTISYSLNEHVLIEGGASLLHYWGASKYPNIIYQNFPSWAGNQFQEGVHAMPYFRAVWQINKSTSFTFGNIDYRDCHNLSEPLYNIENTFSGDPEMGLQIKHKNKWFQGDLWLDWQTFIFNNDKHNESFCLGLYTQTKLFNYKGISIEFPLIAIVQHLGGENLSFKSHIQSLANLSSGLKLNVDIKDFNLHLGGDALLYRELVGNIFPFDNGYAYFYYLGAKYKGFGFKFSFFDSEDFISLLGSQHFCNFSNNTPGLVFDRANQYYVRANYEYRISKDCKADFYFQMWKQNQITGDILLPDYSAPNPEYSEKVVRDGFFSFSIGVVLNIEPSILIKKIN